MQKKTYTREETKAELSKMTLNQKLAYYRICQMNTRTIQSEADRIQNQMHLEIMVELLFG